MLCCNAHVAQMCKSCQRVSCKLTALTSNYGHQYQKPNTLDVSALDTPGFVVYRMSLYVTCEDIMDATPTLNAGHIPGHMMAKMGALESGVHATKRIVSQVVGAINSVPRQLHDRSIAAATSISDKIDEYARVLKGDSEDDKTDSTHANFIAVYSSHRRLLDALRQQDQETYCLLVSLAHCYTRICMKGGGGGDRPCEHLSYKCACNLARPGQTGALFTATDALKLVLMRTFNILHLVVHYKRTRGASPTQAELNAWIQVVDGMLPNRLLDRDVSIENVFATAAKHLASTATNTQETFPAVVGPS